MHTFLRCLFLSVLFVTAACEHPIGVIGFGDLFSATQTRDCSAEQGDCENLVDSDYIETYIAWPRPGNYFDRWDLCGLEASFICAWFVPAPVVQQFSGQTMPATVAIFEPLQAHGVAGVWQGSYVVAEDEPQSIQCLVADTLVMQCDLTNEESGVLLANLRPTDTTDYELLGRIYFAPWRTANSRTFETLAANLVTDCNGLECTQLSSDFDNADGDSVAITLSKNAGLSAIDVDFSDMQGSYQALDPLGQSATLSIDEQGGLQLNSGSCSGAGQVQSIASGTNVFSVQFLVDCPQNAINERFVGLMSVTTLSGSNTVNNVTFAGASGDNRLRSTGTRFSNEVNISAEGGVSANSTFSGFPAPLSVDGSTATSWFSAGPGIGDAVYTWTNSRSDLLASITIFGNGSHANPDFRLGFGFGQAIIEVLNDGQVVFSESVGLGGTPDPNVVIRPNVVGDQVRLTFMGHEDASCGGFSELRILALR